MIVVLAHHDDDQAADLVEGWRSLGAVLCRPGDLSVEGWVVPHPGAGGSFVADGRRYETSAVTGVLVRLAGVDPGELRRLVDADRAYAATEMTALLAHWLDALPARVVNRPSAACLSGPGWSREEWLTRAARVGLPAPTLVRVHTDAPAAPPPLTWATVVGRRVLGGAVADTFHDGLLTLAAVAGAGLLGGGFTSVDGRWQLARVTMCPPVVEADVRGALADLLGRPHPSFADR